MRNAILFLALRISARALPALPIRAAYAVASAAGSCSFLLLAAARRGIESNLAVALPELTPAKRRRLALAAFRHDAMNWVDTLRIPSLSAEQVEALVQVDGWEHILDALSAGKGMILVTAHVGNFDLVGQLVAARGLPLTVPVERMEPEPLYRYLVERRSINGIALVPVEHAARPMIAALRRGEIVGMAADRHIAGRGVTVKLFGRPTVLAGSPASLARLTGAPILLGIGIRLPSNDFQGFVSPPFRVPRSDDHTVDERIATEWLADQIGNLIRRYPAQWLAFNPIWGSDTSGDTPATMEQQKKAAV